jgi:signal transduction histidine kinase
MQGSVRRKWRPGLWAVVLMVLGLVLCLPFAGLLLFRFYANQLVQQTEESLLTQAAVLTAAYEQLYRDAADLPAPAAPSGGTRSYAPLFPSVTMNPGNVLSPRPDATPATEAIGPIYAGIGPTLSQIAIRAQEQTLAGYRFLDRFGTVIAGSAEEGLYLGHVEEVALALNGDTVSVARTRVREGGEPLVYRFSQGTRVRIFVAMPAMVGDDIIGVVYVNRTPNHIFRFLYGERFNLMKAAFFVVFSTGLIGFVFWRFVTRPIRALVARMDATGEGAAALPDGPEHYGTREIEALGTSFHALTARLHRQREILRTYTAHVSHEMKSPLTAIKGAVELLLDADMTEAQRRRFLDNILRDADRMEDLLASMRDFSAVGQGALRGESAVAAIIAGLAGDGLPKVEVTPPEGRVPLPPEALTIVLRHLLENAEEHGAATARVEVGEAWMRFSDDGTGISEGNRARIFEPFFTTRRADGGTGMGLTIVRSVIEAAGGTITVEPSKRGAEFLVQFAA